MTEGKKTLIKIVKEAITDYDSQLEKLDSTRNSTLIKNKELLEKIRIDVNEMINLDQKELKEILIELELSKKDQEELYNFLSHIQVLLKANAENGTTFKLSEKQLSYVDKFLAYVTVLMRQKEKEKNQNKEEIDNLTEKSNKYHSFLQALEKDNENFMEDTELLTLIFKEREVAEVTKRSILIDLMKYNQKLYQRKLNNIA